MRNHGPYLELDGNALFKRAIGQALHNALADTGEREAALVTFLIASSGVGFLGIGGAFWGLVAGGIVLALTRYGAFSPRRLGKPR